jgi:2-keto-4-pentenoate hydratase/2-oxohepta-3-ene-1,7-dioic acid hydratase in catechol pathway
VRWATYRSPTDSVERVGPVHNGCVYGLSAPRRLLDLLGDDGERLAAAAQRALADPVEVVPLPRARFSAPIPVPPSVRDFLAFEAHVVHGMKAIGATVDPDWYELPVFYFSNPAGIIGPDEDVPISPGSRAFDYALEVAAVIGLGGSDLSPERAERHIAGYTILCDWSARDLQQREMRQRLGPVKGNDGATSLGPVLVTPDELAPLRAGNAFGLRMTARVNDQRYTDSNLADIYWSFADMLAYASRGTRLVPGDVFGSGTVGGGCILDLAALHGGERYPWLQPGDTVRLSVEQLGEIVGRIRPGRAVTPLSRPSASSR